MAHTSLMVLYESPDPAPGVERGFRGDLVRIVLPAHGFISLHADQARALALRLMALVGEIEREAVP